MVTVGVPVSGEDVLAVRVSVVRDAKVCGTFEVLEAVDGGVPVVNARVGEKAREKAHCEADVCSHCVGDVVQGPDELSIAGEFC